MRIRYGLILAVSLLVGCDSDAGEKVKVLSQVQDGKRLRTLPDAALREENCINTIKGAMNNTGVDRGAFGVFTLVKTGTNEPRSILYGSATGTNPVTLVVNGIPLATYPVVSNVFQSYWTPKAMPSPRAVHEVLIVRQGDWKTILRMDVEVK